jgi:hypothetical protein
MIKDIARQLARQSWSHPVMTDRFYFWMDSGKNSADAPDDIVRQQDRSWEETLNRSLLPNHRATWEFANGKVTSKATMTQAHLEESPARVGSLWYSRRENDDSVRIWRTRDFLDVNLFEDQVA